MFNRSPRGRHRAPSKLSATLTQSVRATAVVAAAGGIAATASASSASATGAASFAPTKAAAAANPVTPVDVITGAVQLQNAVPAAPNLSVVSAKSLVVQAPATNTATTATSRSTARPALTSNGTSNGGSTGTSNGNGSSGGTTQAPAATGGIIAIAMRYLGVPYVYGGSSPAGFDCSGLTQYVYAQAGISIPRTATAQVGALRHVSNPQPGDLVYFGSPFAHHIGIYAGNNMMIAAPYPGQVVRLQPIYDTPSGYLRA